MEAKQETKAASTERELDTSSLAKKLHDLSLAHGGAKKKKKAGKGYSFQIVRPANSKSADDRAVIATKALVPGDLLFRERPYAYMPYQAATKSICYNCLVPIQLNPAVSVPDESFCQSCKQVVFCTDKCRNEAAQKHKVECAMLQANKIAPIGQQCNANDDLVSLTISILLQRARDLQAKENGEEEQQGEKETVAETEKEKEAKKNEEKVKKEAEAKKAPLTSPSSAVDRLREKLTSREKEKEQKEKDERLKQWEEEQNAAAAEAALPEFHGSLEDVWSMASHQEALNDEERLQMDGVAQAIIRALPFEARQGIEHDEVLKLISIINTNSHALHHPVRTDLSQALGLYPLASIFNHSCYPNCGFSNEGPVMNYRVIQPVAPGEELTVNYIELYQSRRTRRRELAQSKHFDCKCRRCTLMPRNEAEAQVFENDKYLGGVYCKKEGCDGVYDLPGTKVLSKKSRKKAAAKAKKGDAPSSAAPAADALSKDQMYQCDKCGHEVPLAVVEEAEDKVREMYDTAMAVFNNEKSSAQTCRTALENVLTVSMGLIHPRHEIIYSVYPPLINCCGALGDLTARMEYSKIALELAERALPKYFPAKALLIQELVFTIARILALAQNGEVKLPSESIKALRREREELAIRMFEIYSTYCGINSEMGRMASITCQELLKEKKMLKY